MFMMNMWMFILCFFNFLNMTIWALINVIILFLKRPILVLVQHFCSYKRFALISVALISVVYCTTCHTALALRSQASLHKSFELCTCPSPLEYITPCKIWEGLVLR